MRNLEFDMAAFEDLAWWIKQDRAKALRIVSLIKEIKGRTVHRHRQTRTTKTRIRRLLVAAH